ncbi:MAG: HD domain-containing phosphohydrolase [Candidatus Gastranaerophilaceae bacterium]|jgi:putative nucleotidyltransferase with HDIG domain
MKYSILAVDDEIDNLQLLKRTLRHDYAITTVNSGEEAIQALKQQQFDVVITDHKMSGMDGADLLKHVFDNYPYIIRILITAYSDVPILIDAINSGKINRYIKKPWSPVEVVNTVEKALESNKLNNEHQKLVQDFKDLFSGTIGAITEALDAKDSYTFGRSKRVSFYSLRIARIMGLNELEMSKIEIAGLLHDIGMIGVPEHILNKSENLTAEEYNLIKEHVQKGVKILEEIKQLDSVVNIIKFHHERFDGLGYPYKLKNEEIPLGSMIIAVADAFDGMTSDRPYRKGMETEKAIEIIKGNSGKQFNPKVVDAFLEVVHNAVNDLSEIKKETVA